MLCSVTCDSNKSCPLYINTASIFCVCDEFIITNQFDKLTQKIPARHILKRFLRCLDHEIYSKRRFIHTVFGLVACYCHTFQKVGASWPTVLIQWLPLRYFKHETVRNKGFRFLLLSKRPIVYKMRLKSV